MWLDHETPADPSDPDDTSWTVGPDPHVPGPSGDAECSADDRDFDDFDEDDFDDDFDDDFEEDIDDDLDEDLAVFGDEEISEEDEPGKLPPLRLPRDDFDEEAGDAEAVEPVEDEEFDEGIEE